MRRNFPRSPHDDKGVLVGVKPPRDSQWDKVNSVTLWDTPILVPQSSGEHELGWVILNTNNVPKVLFSLYQKSMDGFVPVRTLTIPARPTFAILDDMNRVHQKRDAAPPSETLPDIFNLPVPTHAEYHAAMQEMSEYLFREMTAWLRPGDNTGKLCAVIYLAVSTDVQNWLARTPSPAKSPGPGQPGN